MTDDDILAALDIPLCRWCPTFAAVQWPASWLCVCGEWAVYRLDGCLQVVAVPR